MGSIISRIKYKSISVDAVVHPLCECGLPWNEHGTCGGYKPSRPVENYGTLIFNSNDPLANIFWKLELFFRNLRIKRIS